MGILKRIFGKTDAGTEKRVDEELEQIKIGQVTKIYPVLQAGTWEGIKLGALKQTLIGTQENPTLVATFGYDAPTNFVFLNPQDLVGKDPNAVLREAYENLENYEQEFEVSSQYNGQILTASGKDFSSEKILCKSHMDKAHALLKAKRLLVSIPRRRCMMITTGAADPELLNTFLYLHKHAWNDDSYGNAPILNAIFVVENGEIVNLWATPDK